MNENNFNHHKKNILFLLTDRLWKMCSNLPVIYNRARHWMNNPAHLVMAWKTLKLNSEETHIVWHSGRYAWFLPNAFYFLLLHSFSFFVLCAEGIIPIQWRTLQWSPLNPVWRKLRNRSIRSGSPFPLRMSRISKRVHHFPLFNSSSPFSFTHSNCFLYRNRHSLRRPGSWCQGQAPQGQGTC